MTNSAEDFFKSMGGTPPFTPAKRDNLLPRATAPASIKIPEGSLLPADPDVRDILTATAQKYKINPALLLAMAHQESRYRPDAVGPSTKWGTAKGMFQFLDGTAKGHGIDAFDYKQAADAAAKDLAQQIIKGGVDWAIAHHHAGPNKKLHGNKTAAYAAEVRAKAIAIAEELGIEFNDSDLPEVVTEITNEGQSAEDFMASMKAPAKPAQAPKKANTTESVTETLNRRLAGDMAESGIPIPTVAGAVQGLKRSVARGWEGIQQALNRETEMVTLSPEEAKVYYEGLPWYDRPSVDVNNLTEEQRTVRVAKEDSAAEEARWIERLKNNPQDEYLLPKRLSHLRTRADDSRFAPKDTFKGAAQRLIANIKTPMDLFLQDSIPANAVSYLATLPELERKKFDQVRSVAQAMDTLRDSNASSQSRKLAQDVMSQWNAQTDPSIKRAWNALADAAKEDPGQTAQAFAEALLADPYMVAAPAGIGLKPVRTTQKMLTGASAATTAGRAAKIADAIIDGSITAGTLNVSAGALANLAETGSVNQDEVKLNAAMGVLLGGTLAPIFMKGARAKSRGLDAARAEGALDEALSDMAKADVAMEEQVSASIDPDFGIGVKETALQQRLREMFGIKNEADLNKWKEQRRKEIKAAFKNESDYADYQRFVAEERLSRAAELAAAAEAKARAKAEAAHGVTPETDAVRRQRLQDEYDAAINARNAAEEAKTFNSEYEAAAAEDAARTAAQKLDAEEMYYAALAGDSQAVKQAEANAKRRDASLRTPKWQRGEASPEMVARLGLVGAGAAAGYAMYEDNRLGGAVLGGLAGLTVPAGGSVLRRMRQSGAIASDGQIIAALTKAGKLATKLEEPEIRARDQALIQGARAGDQQAFKQIYDQYYGKIKRFVNKFTANRESWLAADSDDIAQSAFIKAFQKIQEDPDFTIDNLPAYITTIAENEAKMALRSRESLGRGGGDYKMVNEEAPPGRDSYEGDSKSGYSMLDQHSDLPDFEVGMDNAYDNPENINVRDQVFDILRQELEKLPRAQQEVFSLVHLDHYNITEAAEKLGIGKSTASTNLTKAENRIREAIKRDHLKVGSPVPRGQRGSATPEHMQKTAAITAAALGAGTAGYFLTDGDVWRTGLSAAVGAGLASGAGTKGISHILRSTDYRLRDMSPELYGRAKAHGMRELQRIRAYNNATADFITQFGDLPKDVKPIVIRALSTREKDVINKVLRHVGGEEFVTAFDKVRTKLDEVEDELVELGLIKKSEKDYFPFRVKDLEGLKKELGSEAANEINAALQKADKAMQDKAGRPLNEIERSIVINKVLEPYLGKPLGPQRPGFSKARTIQEIPEKLQKYYHDPVETLNSYGVQASKYVERAKFFGKHLVSKNENGQKFVDIGKSIGEFVDDLRNKGNLTDQQVFELKNLLQDRFNGGEQAAPGWQQTTKNLTNAGLLGNVIAAATQLGDIGLQLYRHGPRASTKAAWRQLRRNKIRNLNDFGLDEHIAHEFLSDNWSRKVNDFAFKAGGFRFIDAMGKNFGLNAAIERMMKDAQSPQGLMRLADKYQRAFPDDFQKAVTALKKGEVNNSVELMAFADLTDTQPLTAWELPAFYQKNPNLRILYHLQTFSLRVLNLVYEDAIKNLLSGDVKKTTLGAKNLMKLSLALGASGMATDKIKDLLAGRPVELDPMEIPVNALEALGMSSYDYDRMKYKGPAAIAEGKVPAFIRMSKDVWEDPENVARYVPVVGRPYYEHFKDDIRARQKERRKERGYKFEITVPAKKKEEKKS